MNEYKWESFNHPQLNELRQKYNLDGIISSGKDEFEKQLLLKDWVNKTLPNGTPKDYSQLSALEILEDAKQGLKFWCTEYAFTFLQCATALEWYARKLGVDFDHPKEHKDRHHGITDIWSSQFKKWYVVDAQNNIHYEKDGIPLNALEIRLEYIRNKAVEVTGIIGNHSETIQFNTDSEGFNTPSNYFWFFVSQRNNFLKQPGLFNTQTYLWIDEFNQDKTWYKIQNGESIPHPMYEHQFIKTNSIEDCFPSMK